MIKMAAVVVTVLLLACAGEAPGVTLEITSGSALGVQRGTACLEPSVDVSGSNLTLRGGSGTTFCFGDFQFVGTLTLDGVTYPGTCNPSCIDNTFFSFTIAPFTEPTPLNLQSYHGPYSTTFTMTGRTTLAEGVDFVGAGTTTIGWIFTDDAHTGGSLFQRYDFTVPEPSTVLLLASALLGLIGVARYRRRA